jgi:hypothetical protein
MIDELKAHQEKVLSIMARSFAMIEKPGALDTGVLGQNRWELMRTLRAYQIYKHVFIFDPAIASGTPGRASHAAAMKARCEAMGAAYQAHTLQWSASSVVEREAEYRAATRHILERARNHMARELVEAAMLDRMCKTGGGSPAIVNTYGRTSQVSR